MALHNSNRLRVPVEEAIESMVHVLGMRKEALLLCSTLDENAFVGPGNCFSLEKGLPSDEVLFEFPKRIGAHALLIGSRASASVLIPQRSDIDLTRRLIAAGNKAHIPVLEHVLVEGSQFRLMRASLEEGLLD